MVTARYYQWTIITYIFLLDDYYVTILRLCSYSSPYKLSFDLLATVTVKYFVTMHSFNMTYR